MIWQASAASSRVAFRTLATIVTTVVALLLLTSIAEEFRFSSERIGIYISQHESGILIDGVEPGMPADLAGVQEQDILRGIEGEPVADIADYEALFGQHFSPGQSLSLLFLRADETIEIELTPGVPADITGLVAQFVLVVAYFGLAILAARYRREDIRARLLMIFVALIAIEMAMPVGFTLDPVFLYGMLLFWLLSTGLQIALELHLVSLIPDRLDSLKRHPWIVRFYYFLGAVIGLGLAALAIQQWFIAKGSEAAVLLLAQDATMAAWATVIPAILVWQAWRASDPRGRNQALLVLIGLVPWVAYIFVSIFWPGWEDVSERWANHIESAVLLFFPAAIFVAIFRYGLFDVEHLVRRGLVYGVVAALILILFYALLTSARPGITDLIGENAGMWLITGLALLTGILFRPLRDGVEQLVERGFFPERRALRHRLIHIAGALSDHDRMNELVQRLANESRHAMGVRWAAVVAIEGPGRALHTAFSENMDSRRQKELVRLLNTGSTTFSRLSQSRRPIRVRRLSRRQPDAAGALQRIGAEVLVPLYFQRRMIGILCLAGKQSGELFLREELELLDLFSHQIAASFENLRLFQDATYEELTGLLRREAVLRQLQAECERAARNATPLTVFMIDLDHFKAVNDAHGHLFGDLILERVAQTMRERIRAVDALGRYGGEEFLLVLAETDLDGARLVAEELRSAISALEFPAPDGKSTVQVTASIGIATASARQIDSVKLERELLQHADAAVYEAKNQGRNRIVVHLTEDSDAI